MRLVRASADLILSVFYFGFHILFRVGAHRRNTEAKREKVLWQALGYHLFHRHSAHANPLSERIQGALSAVARNLDLGHAILLAHTPSGCELLALVQGTYRNQLALGKDVNPSQLFNGLLSPARENLAIDSASLTEWHKHPARKDLGWETFVGSRAEVSKGFFVTVGFYDFMPRDKLYTMREKRIVQNLARWLGSLIEEEGRISRTKPDTVENFSDRPA